MRNIITYTPADAPDVILNDTDIFGGVTYIAKVNAKTDLQYGVVSSGQITFTANTRVPVGGIVVWQNRLMGDGANDYTNRGTFIVESVRTTADGRYKHIAYDYCGELDIDVSRWFKTWIYQTTRATIGFTLSELWNGDLLPGTVSDGLKSLVNKALGNGEDVGDIFAEYANANYTAVRYAGASLCARNGWTLLDSDGQVIIPTSINDIDLPPMTLRDLIGYMADICGCFVDADSSGIKARGYGKRLAVGLLDQSEEVIASVPVYPSVTYHDRYMGGMSQEDNDAALPTFIVGTVAQEVNDIPVQAVYTDYRNTLSIGQRYSTYEIERENPFIIPDFWNNNGTWRATEEGSANIALQNLYDGWGFDGLYNAPSYCPCNIRVLNDHVTVPSGNCENNNTYTIPSSSMGYPITFGRSAGLTPEGFILTDDPQTMTDTDLASYTVVYGVANNDVAYPDGVIWATTGRYLYRFEITTANGAVTQITQYTFDANSITATTDILRAGDTFIFDDKTPTDRANGVYAKHMGLVMSKQIAPNGVTYGSTGNTPRDTTIVWGEWDEPPAPTTRTVTSEVDGGIVTLTDAASAEVVSLTVATSAASASVWRTGKNLCKTVDGSTAITNRTLTRSGGVITCNVTGGTGSAVIANSACFDSTFYLPAGTYFWRANGDFSGIGSEAYKTSNLCLRMLTSGGTERFIPEGLFTLTAPMRIERIAARNEGNTANLSISFSAGQSYTLSPQIEVGNSGTAFEAFTGEQYSGTASGGVVDLTSGATTLSGVTNLIPSTGYISVTYNLA